MERQSQFIEQVVEDVLRKLNAGMDSPLPAADTASRDAGVYPDVSSAVAAAMDSQVKLAALSLEDRDQIVRIIKRMCRENAEPWGREELGETGIGRIEHKVEKLKLVERVLGVEALKSELRSDSTGISILEYAPFGVIAMALPATHSIPTMASNAINVIAAGNTAVFSPHPAATRSTLRALQSINREIERETGLRDLLSTVQKPSVRSSLELFKHPDVAIICVTGGPAVVRAAMESGKRVIAAGPGNPPVVVDESADLPKAARAIIDGAAFDNNLLCIGEKEVFVLEKVAEDFISAMKSAGAVQLNRRQIEQLAESVFTVEPATRQGKAHLRVRKECIGKDAAVLADLIGMMVPAECLLLFGETEEEHAFVQEEQMMPFLPVVRVPDIDRAIEAAVRAERGYRHTAMIHSHNLDNVTRMARALNTTLFVHNASCAASLGLGGPGYLSYSIATPTGEGVTTPLTFTRQRQLTIGGALRIV